MAIGAAAARHRRQQRGYRVADAGHVVVRRPARERDDVTTRVPSGTTTRDPTMGVPTPAGTA
ncbi:MAG: hypothetical protein DMF95_04035 [Acidobacteria bacterium]|nr:MAG: hypothetical protein DMF95_04035 [Acidobacteriota bacterium]